MHTVSNYMHGKNKIQKVNKALNFFLIFVFLAIIKYYMHVIAKKRKE